MDQGSYVNFVFGPIPSRRLGRSLGIDPVPLKTCNWNCVYCQLGRSRPLTNERKDYVDPGLITMQVQLALDSHSPSEIDWITFVGSGEPTLNTGLGAMIRQVKQITDIPVAVITNGALLFLPEVQQDLIVADAVLPSLDAGTAALYKRINRPHPHVPFSKFINGMIAFRQVYSGKLWVEVMLVYGLNDSESALREIARHLDRINPDAIHINQPIRPPAEVWVQPTDEEGLLRARAILGNKAHTFTYPLGTFDLGQYENVVEAILAIITRHPMRQIELEQALTEWGERDVRQALVDLETSGLAQIVERFGTKFWSSVDSYYPKRIN